MTEYEKKILKRFDILLKILSVNMKFKLDNRENEILNSLHEGIQWSIKYFYMVALVL